MKKTMVTMLAIIVVVVAIWISANVISKLIITAINNAVQRSIDKPQAI